MQCKYQFTPTTSRESIFILYLFVYKSIFIRSMCSIYHEYDSWRFFFWQILINQNLLILNDIFSFDSEFNQFMNGWQFFGFILLIFNYIYVENDMIEIN